MIVIPTGTDAPIYHWPYATIAMMLINVIVFLAVPPADHSPRIDSDGEVIEAEVEVSTFDRYSLALGDGLHPVQWLTHNFLHHGALHLAGNLMFLWAFGIVVEGKLGASKYVFFTLAVGTMHGAAVQAILLRSGLDGHAAGASAVVYGLLAACLVWAPRNELSCTIVIPIGFRILVFHRELYYTTVALLYIGEQVFGLVFWGGVAGLIMVSEMGHLSGAFWGMVVAVALLKARLVDCEGWDLFTLWSRRGQLARDWKERGERLDRDKQRLREGLKARKKAERRAEREAEEDEPSPEERSTAAVGRVLALIARGEVEAALLAYGKASQALKYWPSQPDLYAIIKALHAREAGGDSIRPMIDHCRRFPAASDKMRLKLARMLIRDHQRPLAALRVLGEIPAGSLAPDLEATRQALVRQADRMREEGVLEVEGDV